MTKLRSMDIVLTNPQMVYFPGQVIEGQLKIDLSADMKMRGPESDQQVVLREGSHVFPFQFVLPQGLPGSFEGMHNCYVRYWLKGTIDKPWKFDHEVKSLFTVGSVLDLNTVQEAWTCSQNTDSKTVCCCCCESEPATATLRLDKTGYVPGEAIICTAEINEGTGRGTHSSKIKLLQTVTYRTHGVSTTQDSKECARLQHGPISPGGTDVFSAERLVVPPLPPSYLTGCKIIDIDYVVKLCVDVLDTPFDLDVTVGVIIGTIPLQSVVQQYMAQGAFTNQPIPLGAPVNFDLPPPSYQECVFGKVDTTDDEDKHARGNMNFAPSYTYYDWINPPPPSAAPSQKA